MKKTIAALVVLAALGGLSYWYTAPREPEAPKFGDKPRVEVIAGSLYLYVEGASKQPLVTGDMLEQRAKIETDDRGIAAVYFPDGSRLRLDPKTTLTLEEGSFDTSGGTLKVRVLLAAGRVWSKVIDLATPESRWQVETSHTVATVRGTAFGVEGGNTTSKVLGSENTIAVAPKDPATGRVLRDREILVVEEQYVEVDQAAKGGPVVKAAELTGASLVWANGNEAQDAVVDAILEQGKSLTPEQLREELLRSVVEKFETPGTDVSPSTDGKTSAEVNTPKEEVVETVDAAPAEKTPPGETTTSVSPKTTTTPTPVRTTPVAVSGIKEVVIVPSKWPIALLEGETLSLKAYAVRTDGTKVDVTSSAVWQVIGEVGFIKSPGIFVAQLSPKVSEFGEAFGVIAAVIKDSTTGKEFVGKTDVFDVRAKVVSQAGLEG